MGKKTKRKCKKCGKEIVIYRDDIKGVVYYDNYYFHTDCLIDNAKEKLQSKRNSVKKWQGVIDNIAQIEEETKSMLRKQLFMIRDTDGLNDYLLEHYNVATIDSRFWQIVRDLGNGIYRQKRCKKVDLDTLYGAWVWGQNKLDEINQSNIINDRGPKTDETRLMYDLAIIVKHINDYKNYLNKVKVERVEQAEASKKEDRKINYDVIVKAKDESKKKYDDDISGILDEIYGED